MIVKQYFEDIERSEESKCGLTRKELQAIKDMSEFIKNYPDRQFDINYLKKKTGLTPAKLQTGFKMLFGRTVLSFIKGIIIDGACVIFCFSQKLLTHITIKTIDFNASNFS